MSLANLSTDSALGFTVFCVDLVDLNTQVTDVEAITVKDVKVVLDGQEIALDQSKILYGNIEKENDNFRIEIFNQWGNTNLEPPFAAWEYDEEGNAVTPLTTWGKTIDVTFTLEGIHWGEPAAPATPTKKPDVSPTEAPSASPGGTPQKTNSDNRQAAVTTGAKKGAKVTSGKYVYKVTKAATAKSSGTLAVTGLSKSGKSAAKLSVPATVKIGKANYKVTALGAKSLKGAKASAVTLSRNIKKIPAGTFANCKKLKALTLKARLTSVKKGAFKGCKKTIKVKGTSKKANLKKLKKSGYKKFK